MSLKTLYQEFGGNCFYCRRHTVLHTSAPPVHNPYRATRDHDVPKCRGGEAGNSNQVLACVRCNASKNDMTGIEFVAFQQTGRLPETYVRFLEDRLAKRLGMQPRA